MLISSIRNCFANASSEENINNCMQKVELAYEWRQLYMRIYNCQRFNSADSVMFLQACRQYIPVMNTPRSAYCEDNLRHSCDYNGRKGRSRANNVYVRRSRGECGRVWGYATMHYFLSLSLFYEGLVIGDLVLDMVRLWSLKSNIFHVLFVRKKREN